MAVHFYPSSSNPSHSFLEYWPKEHHGRAVVAEGRRQQQGLERVERARLLVPEEVAAEPEGLRALAVLEEQAEPEGLREQAVQQLSLIHI